MDERLVRAVMQLYERVNKKVKVGEMMSDAFNVKVRIHQGSVLSPFLFAGVTAVVCASRCNGWIVV